MLGKVFPAKTVSSFLGIGYLPGWQNYWSSFLILFIVDVILTLTYGGEYLLYKMPNSGIVVAAIFTKLAIVMLVMQLIGIFIFHAQDPSANSGEDIVIQIASGQVLTVALSMPAIMSIYYAYKKCTICVNLQSIIKELQDFWAGEGCVILHPYTSEVGAGTLHPATIMSAIDTKPTKIAYLQPVIRPSDGRYSDNPNRLYQHHQYQVIIKPSGNNLQDVYLDSLKALGISTEKYDIKFVEDDWENPSVGASGLGWEVTCNGMEVTQLTYIQQVGGIDCKMIPGEVAYGLERLAMCIQGVDNVYDITWNDNGVTYGDIFKQREYEFSYLALDYYDTKVVQQQFEDTEKLCKFLIEKELPMAAYDQCIKTSHLLNLLDARGVLGVNERTAHIGRVRELTKKCCELYMSK
ncbi:glycine--tRNA ligase alpha subunit [Trichonephila clavata]|uniref:glycine--tRNA ligase n=1 Tax=Trichonephila clavata TaxID=2740835 RepID=A0A8X6M096_TRICU|nr:glycine--tRNA ligase alpha subunit [Trichonephila clavata]